MAKVTINVTQDDILNGVQENAKSCPIACAAKRQFFLRKKSIRATQYHLYVGNIAYILPPQAKRFIDRFDDGLIVRPFSFTTELA